MKYKYDIAISFAEEDRNAAVALSEALRHEGMNAYYYPEARADDVGYELSERLTKVYSEEAAFAVMLSSVNYYDQKKTSVKVELEAIQARMETDPDIVYLIPVMLDKEKAPDMYDFINRLIHLEWQYQPAEVAKVIKDIAGKHLVEANAFNTKDHIIYNSEGPALVIKDSDINAFNSAVIRNSIINIGGNIDQSDRSVNTDIKIDLKSPKETRFSCPFCFKQLDTEIFGRQVCKHCKNEFYLRSEVDKDVTKYGTLTQEESEKYNKLLAHFNNHLRDKNYEEAFKYCKKAVELAPGEVLTWKNFALAEFFLEITRDKSRRKSTDQIMKTIKSHIDKCIFYGMTDTEYDELTLDIANRLFKIEKSRVASYRSEFTDYLNTEIWTKKDLFILEKFLRSFEISFLLSGNIIFLKEYLMELSKPYKWLYRTSDGAVRNSPACVYFDAASKLRSLTERIKKEEPDFEIPKISEERFVIKRVEFFKINSITEKQNYGEENYSG
jgi:hypothetical protein